MRALEVHPFALEVCPLVTSKGDRTPVIANAGEGAPAIGNRLAPPFFDNAEVAS